MEELLEQLEKEYPQFGKLRYVEKVNAGYLSSNHILENENKERLFLKTYRDTEVERISQVHKSKFFFSGNGIPVILPYESAKGRTFTSFDSNIYAIFPFVNARSYKRESISGACIKNLAELLARMHLIGKEYPQDISFRSKNYWNEEKFFDGYEKIARVLKDKKSLDDFDLVSLEVLEFKKKLVSENKINREDLNINDDHLIHGDYHEENVFFNVENYGIHSIFDFEKTCLSPRSIELARSIHFLCLECRIYEEGLVLAKSFFNSYMDIYPICKEEFREGIMAFHLKNVYSLWVLDDHYLQNSLRVDRFLNKNYSAIKYYIDNLDNYLKCLYG